MRITEQDKHTFQKVVDFMERMDGNGIFYTILEDLEQIETKELITEILDIFTRWKNDLNSSSDPRYKTICNFELDLISIII